MQNDFHTAATTTCYDDMGGLFVQFPVTQSQTTPMKIANASACPEWFVAELLFMTTV